MKAVFFCLLLAAGPGFAFGQKAMKDSVYTVVDQMPEFPGGMAALHKYISQHLTVSKKDAENSLASKIIATFVVGRDGKVKGIKIVRSIGPETDKGMIKLLENMPVWTPGMLEGEKVSVQYTLPVYLHFDE